MKWHISQFDRLGKPQQRQIDYITASVGAQPLGTAMHTMAGPGILLNSLVKPLLNYILFAQHLLCIHRSGLAALRILRVKHMTPWSVCFPFVYRPLPPSLSPSPSSSYTFVMQSSLKIAAFRSLSTRSWHMHSAITDYSVSISNERYQTVFEALWLCARMSQACLWQGPTLIIRAQPFCPARESGN